MTTMKQVMEAGNEVADAHAKLVSAADALAELIGYSPDWVLRRVLPLKADDRRNSRKILDSLETEYDEIKEHLEEVAKEEAEASARKELLGKLKLSGAEMKLLGIES